MIDGLKPYPAYKESGLPWLGQLPAHWVIKRGKSYLTCVDERSKTGKEELLTVSSARGVIPRNSATVTMFKAKSYIGHKLCWPGDLVINSLWAWGGGLGVTQHHGIISTAYSVYRSRPSANILPRYLHELVRSSAFNWELHVRSKGIWISRLQLTDTAFLDAPLPLPPPDEQTAIVRFLDFANAKIERAIRAKRKLITLLNEKKQAIIHRAVTRGLDPNVKLKHSGIPWLGDVPADWDVLPLKRLIQPGTSVSYGIVQPGDHVEGGVPFLQTTNVSKPILRAENLQRTTAQIAAGYPRTRLEVGDVVLGIRASIGAAHVVPTELEGANLSRGIARIVPSQQVSAHYLVLFLRSRATGEYWDYAHQGTTFNEVSISSVRVLPVVVPDREKQEAIVKATAESCRLPDAAIHRTECEITLLREYRTALTAEVVTGKLDVREAANCLPAETGDQKPVGDMINDFSEEDLAGEELVQELADAEA